MIYGWMFRFSLIITRSRYLQNWKSWIKCAFQKAYRWKLSYRDQIAQLIQFYVRSFELILLFICEKLLGCNFWDISCSVWIVVRTTKLQCIRSGNMLYVRSFSFSWHYTGRFRSNAVQICQWHVSRINLLYAIERSFSAEIPTAMVAFTKSLSLTYFTKYKLYLIFLIL